MQAISAIRSHLWAKRCYRQLLKSGERRDGNAFLTCRDRDDGIGSQIHSIYTSMALAKLVDAVFVHTPFESVAHNYDDDPEWERKWESFFGLDQLPTPTSLGINQIEVNVCGDFDQALQMQPNVLYKTRTSEWLCRWMPKTMAPVISQIRQLYRHNSKQAFNTRNLGDPIQVVVHIRRGDVSPDKWYADMKYTDNASIVERLVELVGVLKRLDTKFQVNILSQGDESDFREFAEFDPRLFLDHCPFNSFRMMADADILMTAKSGFSYVGALLNENLVVYEPYDYGKMDGWCTVGDVQSYATEIEQRFVVGKS